MDLAKPELKKLRYSLIEEYKTKLDKAGLMVLEKFFSNISRGYGTSMFNLCSTYS